MLQHSLSSASQSQNPEKKATSIMKKSPEDAFYENLTLGLMKTLAIVPRICGVACEKRQPCEKAQLVNWEQRHSVYLPEDMKKFYLSTDGFQLHWSYQYAPGDVRRVGNIHFPHLMQITLLREHVEYMWTAPPTTEMSVAPPPPPPPLNTKDQWGNALPLFTSKAKIFELNSINDAAKVCLVYETTTGASSPKICLLELGTYTWQFLADTFSEYLRMAIAHLGLPYWELCFSSFGLPSWTEQLFLLLAPHLLEEHEPRRSRLVNPAQEHPHNALDPNVFRNKPKLPTKASGTTKSKT